MKKLILLLAITISLFASIESEVDNQRFILKNNILIDNFSDLKWQDSKSVKIYMNWYKAKKLCKDLNLNGIHNWRVPTLSELYYMNKIHRKFKNKESYNYWSSQTVSKNTSMAWKVYNSTRKVEHNKSDASLVRCISGKKYTDLNEISTTINNKRSDILNTKYTKILYKLKQKDSIIEYDKFIKNNKKAPIIKSIQKLKLKKYERIFDSLQHNIEAYKEFIQNYPKAPQVKEVQNNMYNIAYQQAKDKHTIQAYQGFIKAYPKAPQAKEAQSNIYNIAYRQAKEKNSIKAFVDFTNDYKKAPQKKQAIESIYKLTKQQNNISGYEWFTSKYSKAPQVKDAIKHIHKLAYNKAKSINTISAYNTFIISYPYASQVRDANDRAYKLESLKYKRMNKDDEKKARLLAVRIKKLTITMKRKSNKDGYIIVKDRMIKLLTEQYEETDASLRYYESKEFTDFTNTFENVMSNISRKLGNIERYSSEILSTSKQGFEDAKADREMSRYKSEQQHQWEKRMHLRDKGYN